MENFEEAAKISAEWRRKNIILIPDDCEIEKKYLSGMTNGEFVAAFKQMQQLIIDIYGDVEKAPYDWGYPDNTNTTVPEASAYNRISDFLYGISAYSTFSNGKWTVNAQTGLKPYDPASGFRSAVSTHKKIDLIFKKFTEFGFIFGEFGKGINSFTVEYPKNPAILEILHTYAGAQDPTITYGGAMQLTFAGFSYRWVQDLSGIKYEPLFLAKMDVSPKPIQEIQYWLYDKAKEYGYSIDRKKPFDKDFVNYTKGSKQFILVGEKSFNHVYKMACKVIFRDIFDIAPDKVSALAEKYPDVFGKTYASCTRCNGRKKSDEPCSMRICYRLNNEWYENCAYQSFWFFNPTLDSFKDIFELYLIENKVK